MIDKVEGLRPFFKRIILAHKILCTREFEPQGISIFYYCGYRSSDDQDKLYAIGRGEKDTRKKVTWVTGGDSYHQYGWAVDFVPVLGGNLLWEDKAIYERCGIFAESLGLDWAGRWAIDKRESPHIQLTGGLSCADMKKLNHADAVEGHIMSKYVASGMMTTLELVEKGVQNV